ncbi:hypothetical protein LPTSP1_23070 [Leptospira johnsonii]|uniref:Uncharacterized protein n=1 Tax=Leptospira johnsonii TaxID=1917820 RepID=A0A2P2D3S6_9LEPT|nr:hypothetical protein LPTSP1_23070 [Leptospira johnsonii]
MHIVLVFRKKIFGYGFECKEEQLLQESIRIRDRLDRYLLENRISKKCFAAKYESYERIFRGFVGFFNEDLSVFTRDLEEVEIETGKYLKFGNLHGTNELGAGFGVSKRVRTYLEENNIRTDWIGFSSGRNSYLRIIN